MKKITLSQVSNLRKGDRIKVSYKNKHGEIIVKNTRFYGIDRNIILVYVPRKSKKVWEIPELSECVIEKL